MSFFKILLIGIALSMDTFSLSLGLGTFLNSYKKTIILSLTVGLMHFFMPILGMFIGDKLILALELKCDILLGIILIFIGIQMVIDIFKKEENSFDLSMVGMFIFAFGVSLDSFSIGLGIKAITDYIYLATLVFAICSFSFTFLGIRLGSFANKLVGKYANIFGALILFIMGFFHLFWH